MKKTVAALSISALVGAGIMTAYANESTKESSKTNTVDLV